MTQQQPNTNKPNASLHPTCPECGTNMTLASISPEQPGHEARTFECPKCHHSVIKLEKFN